MSTPLDRKKKSMNPNWAVEYSSVTAQSAIDRAGALWWDVNRDNYSAQPDRYHIPVTRTADSNHLFSPS